MTKNQRVLVLQTGGTIGQERDEKEVVGEKCC